jgi:hypothetical protein
MLPLAARGPILPVQSCQYVLYYEKVRVGGHIEHFNDNPISEKFRNKNEIIYEIDAFVNVVLRKV